MKTQLFYLIAVLFLVSCANQTTNQKLDKLEGQEKVLALNTELNELQIALEKEQIEINSLKTEVQKINDKMQKAAQESKKFAEELNRNPGDAKLAKKAQRAADDASDYADEANKLNKKLSVSNEKSVKYQKDIDKINADLVELNSAVKFVPNEAQ